MPAGDVPVAEIDIDEALVRRLLAEQCPDLVGLPLTRLASGCDNVIWPLGVDLTARLPRRALVAALVDHEHRWLVGAENSSGPLTCGFARGWSCCYGSPERRDIPEWSCPSRLGSLCERAGNGLTDRSVSWHSTAVADGLVRRGSSEFGTDGRHRLRSGHVARNPCSRCPDEFSAPKPMSYVPFPVAPRIA